MKNIENLPLRFGQNSFEDLDVFLANQFDVNVYVKYVPGKEVPLWRPYVEPLKKTVGVEFNYVYKDRWEAKMAAYVAALTYILNKRLNFQDYTQKVLDEWREYGLKPDYKTTPKKKEEPEYSPGFNPKGIFNDTSIFNDIFGFKG